MACTLVKLHLAALALAAAALALPCHAAAGDFVFGEDFDGVPYCPPIPDLNQFAMLGTPTTRTGSLGSRQYFLVKLRGCGNVSGLIALSQDGAPASWAATLDPASPTLGVGAYGVSLLSVDVPANAATGSGTFNLYAWHNADLTFYQVMLHITAP